MSRPHNVDPSFPEHKKVTLVKDESQAVGSFLDWLQNENGVVLATRHEHTEECGVDEDEEETVVGECGLHENELVSTYTPVEKLLAEYYKIDLNVLEDEKAFMLRQLQKGAKQ